MKIFLASSWKAIISRIIVNIPYFLFIVLSIDTKSFEMLGLLLTIFISYIIYFCTFGWLLGILVFNKKNFYVPDDLLPKFNRLQYKIKLSCNEIFSIEFKVRDGDSNGKQLYKAWSILYLEIITNDNKVFRINMEKFSKKQCKQIESLFISKVPNLYVVKSINEYM